MKEKQLCLNDFFKSISAQKYAVIKPSDKLPDYEFGSDIDMFCYDVTKMSEMVTSFLSQYVNATSLIKISKMPDNVHIDFITQGKIELRFDLYDKLPSYKNVCLKSAFFETVIEHAWSKEVTVEESVFIIRVPSMLDDCILRYVEYHEYFASRPDKIKHIDYILERFESKVLSKADMLDKLHHYLSFPQIEYKNKSFRERVVEKIEYWKTIVSKARYLLKSEGVIALVRKISSRIAR